MSNKKLVKELRGLRMHLSPLLTKDKLNLLEEAERRLLAGTEVPAPSSVHNKGNKNRRQGQALTKKQLVNKYLYL